jgi:sulfhydrogenase subunit alpha
MKLDSRRRERLMTDQTIRINVPVLARVEGEGALNLVIRNQQIEELQLQIYEPPRFFEKLLEGREPNEVIDAVARICGICPVAYQMTAVHAIEHIFKMEISPWVREMRRLFYCGEWIESHSVHIHMLAAPDFLGHDSVISMAKQYPEIVNRGMQLHALGNELMCLLGKRSVHPVGACVGGFYRAPEKSQVASLLAKFERYLPEAEALVKWTATLPLPQIEQEFTSVGMFNPNEYPFNHGDIVSDQGLKISPEEFEAHFREHQAPYSNALHCLLHNQPYLVGPLARVNLNHQQFPAPMQELIKATGIRWPVKNMFYSIVARALEIYYAMLEAIRIMSQYQFPKVSRAQLTPAAGSSAWCTEAPRGLLWKRFELNENGLVQSAKIVPPTSQNQPRIEADLRYSLERYGLQHCEKDLREYSEKIIRNYDPCISCSTHFLTLNLERE